MTIPAEQRPARTGCVWLACGGCAWIIVLGAALLLIFVMRFEKIFGRLGRDVGYPAFAQLLEPLHTPADRVAFSNAFFAMIACVEHQHGTNRPMWVADALTNILQAAHDRVVTRAESASYMTSVWSHVARPAPPR